VLLATTGEDFARQIGRLFREPALQSRLAANGRRLVEERYSWDALADGLLDQYRAISRATIARTA
jgi:glycosyltransferase involved in cell wall biosynthesis